MKVTCELTQKLHDCIVTYRFKKKSGREYGLSRCFNGHMNSENKTFYAKEYKHTFVENSYNVRLSAAREVWDILVEKYEFNVDIET